MSSLVELVHTIISQSRLLDAVRPLQAVVHRSLGVVQYVADSGGVRPLFRLPLQVLRPALWLKRLKQITYRF